MANVGHAVAEFMAAMWTWLAIVAAWVVSLAVARHSGRRDERRRVDEGRAQVRAAIDAAQAPTVPIPRQRQGADH